MRPIKNVFKVNRKDSKATLVGGVFRPLPGICEGAFCENSEQILTINYFHKKKPLIDVWQVLNTPLLVTFSPVNLLKINSGRDG